MNILFISSDKYPPFRVDVTELFGKEMVSRGHTVDWLLHSEEQCDESFTTTWSGSTVYVGRTDAGERLWNRLRKHWYSFLNDCRMLRLSRENAYDFILVKDKFLAAIVAGLTCRHRPAKFIYWLSYPFPEASLYEAKTGTARYPILYRIRGWLFDIALYRFIVYQCEHLFCQSEQMKKDLQSRGADLTKMTAVPMGFSEEKFRSMAFSDSSKNSEDIDLLYLGTLLGARRMDFLVRVLAEVRKTKPNVNLIFVGDGEADADTQQILDAAQELSVSNAVTITGFLPQDEALKYVQRAKVCLSPFYPTPILNSTSPTKLIEYMAMGKVVVANDHPEQSLVIERSQGGLCVPYEEKAFSDAILYLLEDPCKRNDMGRRGKEYVMANRTYSKIANVVESAMKDLL